MTIPRLVVSGLDTGSGKTTLCLGLIAALRRRGRTVQTFKVGPDFVDCAYLAHASGRPCRNLDAWMLGETGVRRSLAHGSVGADLAVIEGANGLFDGHGCGPEARLPGAHSLTGSSAEVAHLLDAPVVLVLDVATMGETAAAVALGVRNLDRDLNLVGVILDRVRSDHRRRVVEDAVWHEATVPVLGSFPDLPGVRIPELSSGLLPLAENSGADAAIAELAEAAERCCDLDLLERLMSQARPVTADVARLASHSGPRVRIGVAFDEAFCFYFAENLELLEEAGAEVVPFSPLEDIRLPEAIDAIYLGGGITESLVPRVAANHGFRQALGRAHRGGAHVYAESGGLLACARTVRTPEGGVHEMAGLVPVDVALDATTLRSGYRELTMAADGPLGAAGTRLRGHEFHFSTLLSETASLSPAYSVHDCDGEPLGPEGWIGERLVASFVQLHFGQDPGLARRFVLNARRARSDKPGGTDIARALSA
ncbi:MAG: cobyrinate a,c-diamide synthase [Candidatus Dormibacteria bacterium]